MPRLGQGSHRAAGLRRSGCGSESPVAIGRRRQGQKTNGSGRAVVGDADYPEGFVVPFDARHLHRRVYERYFGLRLPYGAHSAVRYSWQVKALYFPDRKRDRSTGFGTAPVTRPKLTTQVVTQTREAASKSTISPVSAILCRLL
jgi:hypothetical protein